MSDPKVTGAPERIWLNVGDIERDADFREISGLYDVTWHESRHDDADIEYVRARPPMSDDLIALAQAAFSARAAHDTECDCDACFHSRIVAERDAEIARLSAQLSEQTAQFNALCLALKTHAGDTDGSEFGLVRVKFDRNGQVESCLWASQDDIDKAIDAAKGQT